jgi:hypothetical protein
VDENPLKIQAEWKFWLPIKKRNESRMNLPALKLPREPVSGFLGIRPSSNKSKNYCA